MPVQHYPAHTDSWATDQKSLAKHSCEFSHVEMKITVETHANQVYEAASLEYLNALED